MTPQDDAILAGFDGVRPTVQLKTVDADELWYTWRWKHRLDEPRVHLVPRALVADALAALRAAVPSPLPGEDVRHAIERAVAGPLGDREREHRLTEELARALLPARLAGELNAFVRAGRRPLLRIQPAPSLGLVPWESLHADGTTRWVHDCDIAMLPAAGVRNASGRHVSEFRPDGPVVAVLDPRVPGGALAPVLPPIDADSPIGLALAGHGDRLRGTEATRFSRLDVDRDRLRDLARDASRLLFVGHVSAGDHGLGMRMHLSCTDELPGRAASMGRHRPLSAADLAFGHDAGGPWQMPARVALVACESGGDLRFAEPTGLVAAMVRGGAEHVTATRWLLPTDAGLSLVGGREVTPFEDAVIAVDAAQEAADPISALNAWQRERAEAWERTGALEHSPIVWGSLTTTWAPPPA